jgi:hypothetical protein
MKTFQCLCGNRLFFDNSECLKCKRKVGFSVEAKALVPIDETTDEKGGAYKPCANYGRGLCNWLVAPQDPGDLCLACRLNLETPAETKGEDSLLFNMEVAKRRLIFSLLELELPVVPLNEQAGGVGFALRRGTSEEPVITGHEDGLITLDLNEADPVKREGIRTSLGEDYRTLLGHFRHEIGHYYWPLFFPDEASRVKFRAVFGDERLSYAEALKKHYESPNTTYADTHVSSYATSHPWEDWAETWAHHLHILDSWETAVNFGLRSESGGKIPGHRTFDEYLEDWSELMIAMNSMNRSMGHDDAYPFQLAPEVRKKLAYVDKVLRENVAKLKSRFPDRRSKAPIVQAKTMRPPPSRDKPGADVQPPRS